MATRRQFLAAAGVAVQGANDRIGLALIGCGARGRSLLIPRFKALAGTQIVAVCDVNSKYLAEGRVRAGGESVAAYSDYCKLMENKDIDAVIIATNQQ